MPRSFHVSFPKTTAALAIASLLAPTTRSIAADNILNLDQNNNGLYEPAERKAVLDVFLKERPEMWARVEAAAAPVGKAATVNPLDFSMGEAGGQVQVKKLSRESNPFDMNGDGVVTIEEETADRPPLAMLVPQSIVEAKAKIPWALDLFAEWLSTAYFQEDVAEGGVAAHVPRGTINRTAAQPDPALQPKRAGDGLGVEFAPDSGQYFVIPGERDARWNYRWAIFTFRIDGQSGESNETVLLDLNRGEGSNQSSPKVWFKKETGLNVQYVGENVNGLDKRVMSTSNIVTDGKTWNVLICGIRYGQMFASVNGVPLATQGKQLPRFSGDWLSKEETTTLGDPGNKQNSGWAYDTLAFGLTEPSEAMVKKMTGWAAHRLSFQQNLPEDHPYKSQRPVLDAEDFPDRYIHNDVAWNAWGAGLKSRRAEWRVNVGGPRVEPRGFERVFVDDFRAFRIAPSTSGVADLWAGPGFNTAVGASVPLAIPGKEPNTYPHDSSRGLQTLSLAQKPGSKKWFGSAFYSINDLGHGYVWDGPKIFRIRCMFPKSSQKELARGLFPAFWSYGVENIIWRTSNRMENDWFEFDAENGAYLNGLSTHYHYAYLRNNIFAKNPGSYQRYKAYGGELTFEKSKIPGGIFVWDGKFHTWEYVIDKDMTYVNVTVPGPDGRDRWVEIFRCSTPASYLEPMDLQLDYALKNKKNGMPKDGQRQDFEVDWIEVLQKSEQVAQLPKPFVSRPAISGETRVGNTITCEANVDSISDVRYYWFADDYPLTYGPDNTYTITKAEAGKKIRCMVKAVGALNSPEAWSNRL